MARDWKERHDAACRFFVPWVDRVFPLEGTTVLEWGCGNGPVTLAFAPHVDRIIGYDISEPAVKEAEQKAAEAKCSNVALASCEPDVLARRIAEHENEIDVVLLFAVLEHMTVRERLHALKVARSVLRDGGVIVVCETPNRLLWWDYHTSELPFFGMVPDELALHVADWSPRADFRADMAAASTDADGGLERLARWGRGVSFVEFELIFGPLEDLVLAGNYELELLPERELHREELYLARFLERARPGVPAAFSRYYIDLVLAPDRPTSPPSPPLRPWAFHTAHSPAARVTPWETLAVPGHRKLVVDPPIPFSELVVAVERAPDQSPDDLPTIKARWASQPSGTLLHREGAPSHYAHPYRLVSRSPLSSVTLTPDRACEISFVGYRPVPRAQIAGDASGPQPAGAERPPLHRWALGGGRHSGRMLLHRLRRWRSTVPRS